MILHFIRKGVLIRLHLKACPINYSISSNCTDNITSKSHLSFWLGNLVIGNWSNLFLGKGKRGMAVRRENSRYFTLRWARESRPCCSCWCARCRWNSCSRCTCGVTLYLLGTWSCDVCNWEDKCFLEEVEKRTLSKKCSAFFSSAETSPSEKQLTCRKNSLSFVFSKYETKWGETSAKVNLWQHLILITVNY